MTRQLAADWLFFAIEFIAAIEGVNCARCDKIQFEKEFFVLSWCQVWRFLKFVCQSIFKETGISPEIDFQKALKGKKDMCNVCKIESVNQKQNVCRGLSLKSLFQRQVHIPSIHSRYLHTLRLFEKKNVSSPPTNPTWKASKYHVTNSITKLCFAYVFFRKRESFFFEKW